MYVLLESERIKNMLGGSQLNFSVAYAVQCEMEKRDTVASQQAKHR